MCGGEVSLQSNTNMLAFDMKDAGSAIRQSAQLASDHKNHSRSRRVQNTSFM